MTSNNDYVHSSFQGLSLFQLMKFLVYLHYIAYYVYKCLISGFDLLQFL